MEDSAPPYSIILFYIVKPVYTEMKVRSLRREEDVRGVLFSGLTVRALDVWLVV